MDPRGDILPTCSHKIPSYGGFARMKALGGAGTRRAIARDHNLFRKMTSARLLASQLLLIFVSAPTAAAERPVTISDLIEVVDISDVAISPDETVAAVRVEKPDVASNRVALTWYVVPLEGNGLPQVVADGGEPVWNDAGLTSDEEPIWSDDSRWLYFRALHGEEVQVWRASRYQNGVEALTSDAADVERFVVDSGGRRVLYTVRATRDEIKQAERYEYMNGVLLDQTVQVHTSLLYNFPYHGRMTTLRRSSSAWMTLLGDRPPRVRVLDIDSRKVHDASPSERLEYQRLTSAAGSMSSWQREGPTSTRDGSKVAFFEQISPLMDKDFGPAKRYRLSWHASKAAAAATVCNDPACTLTRPARLRWSKSGDEIFFISEAADGATTLYGWDIARDTLRRIVSIDGLLGAGADTHHRGSTCPIDGREAICTTATADAPPRLEAINLRSGQRRVLFDPNAQLRHESFSRVEHLTWRDKWGRAVTGILLLPHDSPRPSRLPLVITSYRCTGFLRGGTGADVPEHVLTDVGIAALCVNFDLDLAGVPYPGPDVAPGQESHLQTILDDWEAGIEVLRDRGLIDAERVGVSGLSLGAEAVLYAVSHSTRFAVAAAGHAPFTDPSNYYNIAPAGEFGATLLKKMYKLPPPDNDPAHLWQRISPALNVRRIKAPILIQTDEDEFRGGIQFYASMVTAHRPLEFIVFPDEAHQFMQPLHRMVRNTRNIDWFRFWLQGYEDKNPSKVSQYIRWRQLRASHPYPHSPR